MLPVFLMVFVCFLAVGCSLQDEPDVNYITVPVEKGTLRAEINSSGTLKPLVEVLVGSQVSGYIKELYADFESPVRKGQLIALIDPATFDAKVGQAKADYEAAKATLAKSEVLYADEWTTFKRKQELVESRSISQLEYDQFKAKADAARVQVDVDRARVEQALARLKEAELQLEYTRIVAPVDGVITARNMDIGQTVTASFQTPVLFKIAEDLTRMQVHTNVDEADIGRVRVGQKAMFTVPAFPDDQFAGSVSQIRNDPKIEQNVVTYNVVLDVENPELKLRPGMTASVHVLIDEVHDALKVPDQAFRFTPAEEKKREAAATEPVPERPGQRRIWKLTKERNLQPVWVKVGVTGTEKVQVVSQELKPADPIVVDMIVKKRQDSKQPALRFRF